MTCPNCETLERTIISIGEESMRDQEKLRKAEEQVIRWLKKAGDLQAELGRVEKRVTAVVEATRILNECCGECENCLPQFNDAVQRLENK